MATPDFTTQNTPALPLPVVLKEDILTDFLRDYVVAYVDDILVYSLVILSIYGVWLGNALMMVL